MLNALVRRVDVVADGRANASQLVGGNRCANPGATYHDATSGFAALNQGTQRPGDVREVDRRLAVRTDIRHGMTPAAKNFDDWTFQSEPGVVAAHHQSH